MDAMTMARDERAELADFLETLRPEQWDVPTLCSDWRVRDVVAHVISYEEHDRRDMVKRVVKARFRPGRINQVALADYSHLEPDELIAFLRSHLDPRGNSASLGGAVGFIDALVHQQDIRRPLGLPREIPVERLQCALPFAVTAPPLRGFWHARGVRLVATDVGWSRGRGPEAQGSAEAVLTARSPAVSTAPRTALLTGLRTRAFMGVPFGTWF
jgi:uncharacterized protein (TIGR03083 family)